MSDANAQNPTFTCTTAGTATLTLSVADGDPAASCADTLTTQVICSVAGQTPGTYVAGDFHNHTTCSDGSISMQKLVQKATGTTDGTFGLDWFVQAGHGGNGNRNCTLVEDATLATPAYPYVAGKGRPPAGKVPGVTPKGDSSGTTPNKNMWRWQSIQEFQYPLIEYLNAYKNVAAVPGHRDGRPGSRAHLDVGDHGPSSEIDRPAHATDYAGLHRRSAMPTRSPMGVLLRSRRYGHEPRQPPTSSIAPFLAAPTTPIRVGTPRHKADPASGAGTGTRGHQKTIEWLKWMAAYHPDTSYYVPAHLERAGQFNPGWQQRFQRRAPA